MSEGINMSPSNVEDIKKAYENHTKNINGILKKYEAIKKTSSSITHDKFIAEVDGIMQELKKETSQSSKTIKKNIDGFAAQFELLESLDLIQQKNSTNKAADNTKEIQGYIDNGFMLMSNIVNEKYKDIEDNITNGQSSAASRISSTIVESYHNLFVNICNENFKHNEDLKKKLKNYFYILTGIGVLIWLAIITK